LIYKGFGIFPLYFGIFPPEVQEKYFEMSGKTLEIIQNRGSNIAITMTNMITIPFCHASHYSIYTPWVSEGLRTLTSYPNYRKEKKQTNA
jgi:hypothetical protein